MPPTTATEIFPIFFAIWVVLGLGSFAFFHFNKNAALKRRIWPAMMIFSGLLFIAFVWLMGFKGEALFIIIPAIILISALNIRGTKFCDSCGKTLYGQSPFTKMEFCPKCGNKLL